MSKKVLVAIADGSEETEAVSVIDTLVRAGADVMVASVTDKNITASRGVKLVADKVISECAGDEYDLIVLPGGKTGAENLRDSEELVAMLKKQASAGKLYAAICAAPPVVLAYHGLLEGKKATCYPARHDHLPDKSEAHNRVVVDGNCVTSQGPGTAIEFAVKLVELLYGKAKADEIASQMLVA